MILVVNYMKHQFKNQHFLISHINSSSCPSCPVDHPLPAGFAGGFGPATPRKICQVWMTNIETSGHSRSNIMKNHQKSGVSGVDIDLTFF